MAPEAATFEAEEFWEDLLAFIEEGRVIPVLGAELLTVEDSGAPVGLMMVPLCRRMCGAPATSRLNGEKPVMRPLIERFPYPLRL